MYLIADSQPSSSSSFGEQNGIIGENIPPTYLLPIIGLMASDLIDPKKQLLANDPYFFGKQRTFTLVHSVMNPPEDFILPEI